LYTAARQHRPQRGPRLNRKGGGLAIVI